MRYELTPKNGRKSFWGKATVEIENGWETLFSYNTPIIKRNTETGELKRIYDCDPSCTTCSHIKSFCGLDKKHFLKVGK